MTPNIPAWCLEQPEILFDLHSGKKSESNPLILKNDFRKLQTRFKNYQHIYTDGSKEDSTVGCVVISDNHCDMQRIPDGSSIALDQTYFKILFSNFKTSIIKYILAQWQASWNNSIDIKLLEIKTTIGEHRSAVRNIRKEVVLARIHFGHTRVTHSNLLLGGEQPQCVGCDAPFTVRHFLLECGEFSQVRNRCFHFDNMNQLFQDLYIDSMMTFLKVINLVNKVSKGAKIRNRYNQVPHLTRDTIGKVTNSQLDTTNRRAQRHSKHKTEKNIKIHKRSTALKRSAKYFNETGLTVHQTHP